MAAADEVKPELVLVSAGFDSRAGDPLGQFLLSDDDFGDLTRVMREDGRQTRGRPFAFGAGRRVQLDGLGCGRPRARGGFAVSTQRFESPQAAESDVPVILSFIRKLAEYEKLSHLVVATEDEYPRARVRRESGGRGSAGLLGRPSRWASRCTSAIFPRFSARPASTWKIFSSIPSIAAKESGKRC